MNTKLSMQTNAERMRGYYQAQKLLQPIKADSRSMQTIDIYETKDANNSKTNHTKHSETSKLGTGGKILTKQ